MGNFFEVALGKVIGTENECELKKLEETVAAINELDPAMERLADADFPPRTEQFKKRVAEGEPTDNLLVEAFALRREAGRRALNVRHFGGGLMVVYLRRALLILSLSWLVLMPPCALFPATYQAVSLTRVGDQIHVTIGGRPFTTYHFDPKVAKPYFQPLRSAQGTIVTRNFPDGDKVPREHLNDPNLEPHQRPMDFGHGNVDGIDFWGEAAFPKWSDDSVFGRTVFRKIEQMRGGPESGVLRADFDLVGPRGRVIAEETQSYTFRGNERGRMIDCEFVIIANHGAPVTMGDTKEGTFEIRLAKPLNSPPAQMVNSMGAHGEKQIWGKRADWVDYDGVVNGEPVGVAIFDSPRSFRHPTYWHARAYGLFAANPFGIREFTNDPKSDGSWTISEGHSLTFRYRVFIHHGNYIQAGVAKAYAAYTAGQQ